MNLGIRLLYLAALTLMFSACSGKTITGKVVIKGQIPHTFIAVKVDRRLYYHIVGRLKRVLLAHYQGDSVTLAGSVVREAVGQGLPAQFKATRIVSFKRRER
ncbi:MAG: hypothetical protein OEW60_02140 [Thiovulaceae bacterium]|nr:hypothetical protein [Sulfurimonadaceae bacterium]